MPPANRQNPKRVSSSQSLYSTTEFLREFPDDEACLQYLWRERHSPDGEHAYCPKCKKERVFKRYDTKQVRQSWTCTGCGHHIHPTAGTIFHKSSTSLQLWFHAMFLVSSSRCGIAAKQLERDLGCNYKTAWRMLNRIRNVLMEQDGESLSGKVEADETFIGGRIRRGESLRMRSEGKPTRGPATKRRAVVFGAVERGGRIRAEVVPSSKGRVLKQRIGEFVLPASMIFTDDYSGYDGLNRLYHHRRINHRAKIYVQGDVHTNTIEGFFSHFKNDVRGTHHSLSKQWLGSYLNEWVWKWNHRDDDEAMFRQLLASAAESAA